jgi:hypothetical protein
MTWLGDLPVLRKHVACQLLTSLEMQIVLRNSALYLIILSGDLCWNFAYCIVVQKSFNIPNIKNWSVMPRNFYRRKRHFVVFQKNALQNCFMLRPRHTRTRLDNVSRFFSFWKLIKQACIERKFGKTCRPNNSKCYSGSKYLETLNQDQSYRSVKIEKSCRLHRQSNKLF